MTEHPLFCHSDKDSKRCLGISNSKLLNDSCIQKEIPDPLKIYQGGTMILLAVRYLPVKLCSHPRRMEPADLNRNPSGKWWSDSDDDKKSEDHKSPQEIAALWEASTQKQKQLFLQHRSDGTRSEKCFPSLSRTLWDFGFHTVLWIVGDIRERSLVHDTYFLMIPLKCNTLTPLNYLDDHRRFQNQCTWKIASGKFALTNCAQNSNCHLNCNYTDYPLRHKYALIDPQILPLFLSQSIQESKFVFENQRELQQDYSNFMTISRTGLLEACFPQVISSLICQYQHPCPTFLWESQPMLHKEIVATQEELWASTYLSETRWNKVREWISLPFTMVKHLFSSK